MGCTVYLRRHGSGGGGGGDGNLSPLGHSPLMDISYRFPPGETPAATESRYQKLMGCTVARRRHGSGGGGGDDGGGGGSLAPLGSFLLMDISYRPGGPSLPLLSLGAF